MISGFSGRLLAPGIGAMSRIGYTSKFTLLWAVSFAAICVSVAGLYSGLDRTITLSKRQIEGIPLIRSISEFARIVQQHRGLSVALLSGNPGSLQNLASKNVEADKALASLTSLISDTNVGGRDDHLKRVASGWNNLRETGLSLSVIDNFAMHTRLVNDISVIKELVADEYLMTVDPDISTSYLFGVAIEKLPHVLEHFGQLRAYGTGVLTRKQITEVDRAELKAMLAELDKEIAFLMMSIDKVERSTPTFASGILVQAIKQVTTSANWVSGIVVSDLLSGHFAVAPETFLDLSTSEINKGYAQLHDYLLPALESMVNDRISRARGVMYAVVGGVTLLFLLMIYFSICIYCVLTGSIVPLKDAFSKFSGGNLKARVDVKTSDEMRVVGERFNDMADKFEVLIKERADADNHLRAIIDGAMDAVVCIDGDDRIIGWNNHAEKMFGRNKDEIFGRPFSEVVAFDSGNTGRVVTGEMPVSRFESIGLRRDGERFPIEISVALIGGIKGCTYSAFIRDITQKKVSDEMIWHQANFDVLTELPNRRMFHDRLDLDIRRSQRSNLRLALLFIDLDKFKEVNDTLGHGVGDILLKEASQRIRGCVRETDTVARLGGDEFTIILSDISDTGCVNRIASEVLRSLEAPFHLGQDVVHISASIGITVYPDDAGNADDLIRNADQAMYAAKNGGRNGFQYFTSLMQVLAQDRLRMTNELRQAVIDGEFCVYYQPIIEIASRRIAKVEALVRWIHPERGLVSPSQFIPLAEESGLIVEIGNWVFREATRQIRQWRDLCDESFQVSVNVSPVQFRASGISYKAWLDHLNNLELPANSVVIEITEGLLLDATPSVVSGFASLRAMNIKIAIDDFGTGYSSLAYIKKFDIDYLKIDQNFVHDLASNPDDMALAEAIVVMAHKLGLKVIAEGVESYDQLDLLSGIGCDYAQGFLFSMPVPARDFEVLLASNLKHSHKKPDERRSGGDRRKVGRGRNVNAGLVSVGER